MSNVETLDIIKMTSLEQLLGVKNPGARGGTGYYDENGVWRYTKPSDKKFAPQQNNDNEYKQKIQQLKQSYINYFSNKTVKVLYKVQNNKFIFPDLKTAIKNKLVKNEEEYERLFKEQYMHYALTNRPP